MLVRRDELLHHQIVPPFHQAHAGDERFVIMLGAYSATPDNFPVGGER